MQWFWKGGAKKEAPHNLRPAPPGDKRGVFRPSTGQRFFFQMDDRSTGSNTGSRSVQVVVPQLEKLLIQQESGKTRQEQRQL
jgi:hypothetical protein